MTKKVTHIIVLVLFIAFATFQTFKAVAEGTSTVTPTNATNCALSTLPSQNRGSFLGCPQDNRVYFRITDHNTENLYYGFSWRNYSSALTLNAPITNMYMRVFNPLGVQVAQINLPSSGTGFITDYTSASIGANVAGSHPGGYDPLSIDPTMNGEYWVEFYRSNDGGNTMVTGTTWSFSNFWDLQVANSAGVRKNGRIHCDKWAFNACSPSLFTTRYNNDANPLIYAWSNDSCSVKISFEPGFRPIAFDVAVTSYGVVNTNNFSNDRKSINSNLSPSFSNGYTLFVNEPDPNVYPPGVNPSNPQLEKPIIVGCSAPFKIRYTVHGAGDVRLLLDLNGVPGYQPGTSDLIIEQFNVSAGLNIALWNGLNGLGAPVPSGTSFKLVLTYLKGRFNVPIYDAEINKNGFDIETVSPVLNSNVVLYWDDTNLPNVGVACADTVGGADNQNNITGAGINNTFIGSVSPAHAWSGDGNPNQLIPAPTIPILNGNNETINLQCATFGNVRAINTFGWAIEAQDSADVLFACLQVAGTIWNDKDGSANGTFNNIFTMGENGTNLGNTLYVSLVDPVTGEVLQSVPVNADGTYLFTAVPPNAIGLQIVLSNIQGVVGAPPPMAQIDPKWQNTSPLVMTFNTTTVALSNLDFGIRTQDVTPDINQTLVNTPVSGSVATNDNVIPGSTFTPIGNMSNGNLVMNPDGTYTYTPNDGFVGTDSISYIACSPVPVICDTTTLTIVVNPLYTNFVNTVIAQDDHATTPINTPVNMCLLCNDSDPNGGIISNPTILQNPTHGTVIVNPDGSVTYTPNPGFYGDDVFQYFICDNQVPVACDTAYAYVTIVPDPVTVNQTYANDDAYVTLINTPITSNVGDNDTDPQNDNVTFTQVTNPTNGTVVLNADGTFTYTPNLGYSGPDQFIYSKCDDGTPVACDTATVYITIHKPFQNANPDINQTLKNTPVSGSVATNDNVIPGSTFTQYGSMSNGTLVLNPDGTYTYTPNPGFVGRDSVQYIVCSPPPVNLCDTTTLTIIVIPPTELPFNTVLAQDDHATTPLNTPVGICVLCNDSDPQGHLISLPTAITNPSNGTIVLNPDGSFTYTPNTGFSGKDEFIYYICDNGTPIACDTATVYIDILPIPITVNQTYANDDAYTTMINTPVSADVSLNDTDPQGDNVNFTLVTNPQHGTVILNTDGTFTYFPELDYIGPDYFLYSKCDDGTPVACDTATVYITIIKPGLPLPAIMGHFGVISKDCASRLEWTTLQEKNVSHFEIYRTSTQVEKQMLGKVNARGNTDVVSNYHFEDSPLKSGNYEYFLKIVDIDGQYNFSETKNVSISCGSIANVKLYPNPTDNQSTLTISTTELLTFDIKMYDPVGKLIYHNEVDLNNEFKSIDLNVNQLSSGIYTVVVFDGTEKHVLRLMKK